MCKLALLRKGVLSLKELLKRYETSIPQSQKFRFQKDLAMIFSNAESIDNENELLKMDKLAKTKLRSIERIYGKIREETKKDKNLSTANDEILDNLQKLYKVDLNSPRKSIYEELKASDQFNPDIVKLKQKEILDEREIVMQAYKKVQEEIKEGKIKKKEKLIDKIFAQDAPLDLSDKRDTEGNIQREKLKEAVTEILNNTGFENPEEQAESVDFETLLNNMESDENNDGNKILEAIKQDKTSNVKYSEQLFSNLNKPKEYTSEEVENFLDKIKPYLNDENLSEDQKKKKVLEEFSKFDNEYKLKQFQGEITYDKYGELSVKFYNNEENTDQDKETNTNENNSGVKNYVWRDGKLVEGRAKERKVVTYSNWHKGHYNPDDMRKHRELLDRQHFGGPLWEGIKYVSTLDEPEKWISPPTKEQLAELALSKRLDKKTGKHEIVEVDR